MVLGGVRIPAPGRIFGDGGHSSFGQRDNGITEDILKDDGTDIDHRLQEGDVYLARGHNLELVSQPLMLALLAVGSISKLCRKK